MKVIISSTVSDVLEHEWEGRALISFLLLDLFRTPVLNSSNQPDDVRSEPWTKGNKSMAKRRRWQLPLSWISPDQNLAFKRKCFSPGSRAPLFETEPINRHVLPRLMISQAHLMCVALHWNRVVWRLNNVGAAFCTPCRISFYSSTASHNCLSLVINPSNAGVSEPSMKVTLGSNWDRHVIAQLFCANLWTTVYRRPSSAHWMNLRLSSRSDSVKNQTLNLSS